MRSENSRLSTYVMIRTTEISRLSVCSVTTPAAPVSRAPASDPGVPGGVPTTRWKMAGMKSAIALSTSSVELRPAAVRLNCWRGYLSPPYRALAPNTSRMLPMIDPVIDAFTRS